MGSICPVAEFGTAKSHCQGACHGRIAAAARADQGDLTTLSSCSVHRTIFASGRTDWRTFCGKERQFQESLQHFSLAKHLPFSLQTLVLISLYTAGRDSSHFEHPLRVLPERWIVGETEQVHKAHGSLPFGIGQRSCIGRRVALKQLHSLLAKCATQFTMRCLNEHPVDSILRMVTVPNQSLRLAIDLNHKSEPI